MPIQPHDTCVICLEVSEPGDIRSTCHILPCGHQFHLLCLYRWKIISQTCPLCRVAFEIPPVIYKKCSLDLLREIVDIQGQIVRDLTQEVRSLTSEIDCLRHQYQFFFARRFE